MIKKLVAIVLVFILSLISLTSYAETTTRNSDFSYCGLWTSSRDIDNYWEVEITPSEELDSDYNVIIWYDGEGTGGAHSEGNIKHTKGKQHLHYHDFEFDERNFYIDLQDGKVVISGDKGFSISMGNEVDFDIHKPILNGNIEEPMNEYTINQATLKFTNWSPLDNGHVIHYTIKNDQKPKANSNIIDTSRYAVVLYGPGKEGEVHILESKDLLYGETVSGTFHTQFGANSVLDNKITTIIVKFDDALDKQKFENGIPMNKGNDYWIDYLIDDGIKGQEWFQDNFNINIKGGL